MFDPRDIASDPRQTVTDLDRALTRLKVKEQALEARTKGQRWDDMTPHDKGVADFITREKSRLRSQQYKRNRPRDHAKEREQRQRDGSRAEFDPRSDREGFKSRIERAVAEIGMYRSVAYKDISEAHFDRHPYATRRAVDRMIQSGDVHENTAQGPQGGTYKVLTLTEKGIHRAEVAACAQGLDSEQKAWSGLVKSAELQHDTAVFRAARIEQGKLIEKGAVVRRVRIDAELKREVARASETARMKGGKEEADAARVEKAAELGLPVKAGKVEYPDAQLEYDIDGHSGRVNVEIATEHYSAKSIGAKAAAGFAVHGSNGRAASRVARALGQDDGRGGGGSGGGRDKASIEL